MKRTTIIFYLTVVLCLSTILSKSTTKGNEIKRTRCGGTDHSKVSRPCAINDTFCGSWLRRYFKPLYCDYEDLSV